MIQIHGPITLPAPVRLETPKTADLSWLEISLGRLERNITAIRHLIRPSGGGADSKQTEESGVDRLRIAEPMVCAVVKKNAYGHGVVPVAHRLQKAGVDMLTVYDTHEAEELVSKAITCPILILMPVRALARTDALYRHAVAGKLHLTIHDTDQVSQVNQIGQTFGMTIPVHFYLDTGMSRGGLNVEQFAGLLESLDEYRHIRVAGIYSHLASSDCDADFAYEQLDRFESAVGEHAGRLANKTIVHIANTCGLLRDRRFHLDMVRPGISLYGYGPQLLAPGPVMADTPQLEPVLRWVSRLIHVQRYPRRTPVGYGSTHKLRKESVLGVVPVGYGDGYPVELSNKACVRIHPRNHAKPIYDARVLGKVNMDQMVVDLTEIAGEYPGDLLESAVEVISSDPHAPNAMPRLAELARTHCYELLCRLPINLSRKYIQD